MIKLPFPTSSSLFSLMSANWQNLRRSRSVMITSVCEYTESRKQFRSLRSKFVSSRYFHRWWTTSGVILVRSVVCSRVEPGRVATKRVVNESERFAEAFSLTCVAWLFWSVSRAYEHHDFPDIAHHQVPRFVLHLKMHIPIPLLNLLACITSVITVNRFCAVSMDIHVFVSLNATYKNITCRTNLTSSII